LSARRFGNSPKGSNCHPGEVPRRWKTLICRSTVTVNGLGRGRMRAASACAVMWRALGPMDTSVVRSTGKVGADL
jgi:hypothetical protein